MLTYDPSLSQHMQRAYVTLVDVLTHKTTASLSRLRATAKHCRFSAHIVLGKNYLPINTVAPGRYVISYSQFVPSMGQNQNNFLHNFEARGFCPTQFLIFTWAFADFWKLGPILTLDTGLSPILMFKGFCLLGAQK
jgi:hypothetical protein